MNPLNIDLEQLNAFPWSELRLILISAANVARPEKA